MRKSDRTCGRLRRLANISREVRKTPVNSVEDTLTLREGSALAILAVNATYSWSEHPFINIRVLFPRHFLWTVPCYDVHAFRLSVCIKLSCNSKLVAVFPHDLSEMADWSGSSGLERREIVMTHLVVPGKDVKVNQHQRWVKRSAILVYNSGSSQAVHS